MKIKTPTTKKAKTLKPKSNVTMSIAIGVIIIVLLGAIYFGLSKVLATESYYVLNADVPAKTQITERMLKEITTAKGTSPQNAINLAQVQQGSVYSKYPLKSGDVISASNTGLNLDSSTGIPDDWSITSFNISTDDAVGGNIAKGDYFDVIGVTAEGGAKYLFKNVLALEANYNQGENTVTEDGKIVQLGETVQYIVGMPSDKVAIFQHALSKYEKIKLALAPASVKYDERKDKDLSKAFTVSDDIEVTDLYEGSDNSFANILRDQNGRPVTIEACETGKISPKSLCAEINSNEKGDN